MKLIFFLLRTSPRIVIAAIIAGLIAGVSNTGLLALINKTLSQHGTSATRSMWAFVALCTVMLVSRCASSVSLAWLARGAIYELRMKLCRSIIGAPLRQLEQLGAPRLLATLTDDVPAISGALTVIPMVCMHIAIIVTSMIYLAWLSWPVFIAVSVFMVFGVLSYYIPFIKAYNFFEQNRQGWDVLFKHFQGLMHGTKELKLHRQRRTAFFDESLEPTASEIKENGRKADTIHSITSGWGQLLVFVLIGLLLFAGPAFRQIDQQTLTGYSLIVLYMMTPLEVLLSLMPTLARANVALRTVDQLGLSLESELREPVNATIAPPVTYESLELRNITHTYRREGIEESFVCGPVDLSFNPCEIVFLTGGNGSGKTTLAKLLTGLYSPESGNIRLNGELVTDANRENYRQLFSTVFSDFYLFDTLLGLDGPDLDARTQYYLSELQLTHKVNVTARKLSTTELSQGQRKRLALLTAYLEDRPFYVFDEWAADQDPYFKETFYLQLLPELKAKGKTVLVISHDDRYYYMADRVIKLDYGKVISETTNIYEEQFASIA
ncbi:MAG TPA: cyclic peptide export ABC transporter [Pyrinomonadaceae bacterium]|nr:cyclic peptide export ABC transporter [Pyrinomonadaceae bacterium]